MKLKEFKFSDQDEARYYFMDKKIHEKVNYAMKYLVDKLPVNELTKDNTFDFDKIEFNEGKNYDWFWLVTDKTKLLVRKYSHHFTIFVNTKGKSYHDDKKLGDNFDYYSKSSAFIVHDNDEKYPEDKHDELWEDEFKALSDMLPQIIELIEEHRMHSVWNSLSLKRPKWVDVKLIFDGKESVHSMSKLLFACDELFGIYQCRWAETDCIEILKTKKVGDRFGKYHEIVEIKTEFPKQYSDPYYHAVGVSLIDVRDAEPKSKFQDVYSIVRWYSDDLFYKETQAVERALEFIYDNHDEIISQIKPAPFLWMSIDVDYVNLMLEKYEDLYGKSDKKYFFEAIEENGLSDFIRTSYRIKERKLNKEKC